MKTVWIMCADSESGDHYHCCASWDHEPSQDEINRAKIELDCEKIEADSEDLDEADFIVDGVSYKCWTYEEISKITI